MRRIVMVLSLCVCVCMRGRGEEMDFEITSYINLHDSISYYVKITKEYFKHLEWA